MWLREERGYETEKRLRLTWIEHDGPKVDADIKPGFGTGLLRRSVEYELSGTAALEMAPDGLRCTIEFPLCRLPAPAIEEEINHVPS